MNAISVDNECFFSDHIIIRKPDLLTNLEYKRSVLCALPHEPKAIVKKPKNKPPADDSSESDEHYDVMDDDLRYRKRSKSLGDFENNIISY